MLPQLTDIADTAFTNNHCLWYAGQQRFGSDSVVRVGRVAGGNRRSERRVGEGERNGADAEEIRDRGERSEIVRSLVATVAIWGFRAASARRSDPCRHHRARARG